MKHFKKTPKCEICKKNAATYFSCIDLPAGWLFTCSECERREEYAIEIFRFFKNARSTIDWIAHLNEKKWMNWVKFADMMERFRSATDSYGAL